MRRIATVAVAALLLAACNPGFASPPPSGTRPALPSAGPGEGGLGGREFWSTAVQGVALAPGTRVRLVFDDDGTIGASAGCNTMGGTWGFDGTTLTVQVAQMTEMGCPEDRMAQDGWLVDWLSSGATAAVDGDQLLLTGSGVMMTLLDRVAAEPDVAIEGVDWVLSGIRIGSGDDGIAMSVPVGVQATLRLDDGQLTVDTGCNRGGASATADDDSLSIGPLALTKRGCQGDAARVEAMMTSVLQGSLRVDVAGRTLHLGGPEGGLDFVAE